MPSRIHFVADTDPTFHFDADPDSDPDPSPSFILVGNSVIIVFFFIAEPVYIVGY